MTYFFKIWKYARWAFPIASVSFLLAVPYMWVGTAIMAILYPLAVLAGATAINFTLLYADGVPKTLIGYLHAPLLATAIVTTMMVVYYLTVPVSLQGVITDNSLAKFMEVLTTCYTITIVLNVVMVGFFLELCYRDKYK